MAAQNEARAAGNDQIRPEHLVLGLLSQPDALAAKSILAQGVTLETVRQAATATLPPAADQVSELVPFDPQARKALELTFREALRLGHNYIGTEHILLALLELEGGTGVLADPLQGLPVAASRPGRVLSQARRSRPRPRAARAWSSCCWLTRR